MTVGQNCGTVIAYGTCCAFTGYGISACAHATVSAISSLTAGTGHVDANAQTDACIITDTSADDSISMNVAAFAAISATASISAGSRAADSRAAKSRIGGNIAGGQHDTAVTTVSAADGAAAKGISRQSVCAQATISA